jgi:hypothetical protein
MPCSASMHVRVVNQQKVPILQISTRNRKSYKFNKIPLGVASFTRTMMVTEKLFWCKSAAFIQETRHNMGFIKIDKVSPTLFLYGINKA